MYRIGVDLGGTNIAVGLVNETFEIVTKSSLPTRPEREGEEIVKDIATLCKKVAEDAKIPLSEVASVGIASPGIVDDKIGEVVYTNNIHFEHFPIIPLLKKYITVPEMHIENDANAAAWGEAVAGAAKGSASSVMITLGTGVGGGIILGNRIFKGFNSAAGELGHTVLSVGGEKCTCGRRGCWETYSSATGLIRMTKRKMNECEEKGIPTKMTEIAESMGKINGRTAFEGYRAGDEAATEVVNEYIRYLAEGLTNMVNIFQPEVLSIGGGISNEGQLLLDLVTPFVKENCYGRGIVASPEIRIAMLKNDAGIIGGAVLGL